MGILDIGDFIRHQLQDLDGKPAYLGDFWLKSILHR